MVSALGVVLAEVDDSVHWFHVDSVEALVVSLLVVVGFADDEVFSQALQVVCGVVVASTLVVVVLTIVFWVVVGLVDVDWLSHALHELSALVVVSTLGVLVFWVVAGTVLDSVQVFHALDSFTVVGASLLVVVEDFATVV